MFNTPLSEITFEHVDRFCGTFEEGVRVEYKRELPRDIPKVIASFANTVGGICLLGVETEPATNRPKLPIVGMESIPGIEERLVQSSQTGIYPAVAPAVRVLDVPGQPGRVVVVVKVDESIEAPHAIENSTRVYIRTGSVSQPYELADIARIEYLIKRRQEPERRREEIIQQMAARFAYRETQERIRVVVAPVYPRGAALPMDTLADKAEALQVKAASVFLRDFRLIHAGILSTGGRKEVKYHFEADTHGVVFYEGPLTPRGYVGPQKRTFFLLIDFLSPLAHTLNTALRLLTGQVTNVLLRCELFGCVGHAFLVGEPSSLAAPESDAEEQRCLNERVTAEKIAPLASIAAGRLPYLTDLARQLLYAFNYRHDELPKLAHSVLTKVNLI